MFRRLRPVAFLPFALALACASSLGPADRSPVRFSEAARPPSEEPFPNWPAPPAKVVTLMTSGKEEVRSISGAGGGTTGAEKHTLYFPEEDLEFSIKWKTVPGRLDGFNNSPRKELATYEIQRIFLDPEDYVVPATGMRCVPLEEYRERHPMATATVRGTHCVLGVVSVWMKNVTVPDVLYDEERFLSDPQYAYYMSNMNLFTYLVDHRDGRDGNFLVSKDDGRRQVFAVDNGISFGPVVFNYFVPNWTKLRVAALRRDSVDRLRMLRRKDLDFLLVVAQLEADDDGILRTVPPGPPDDPDAGVTAREGTVQFGLTRSEIDDVFGRIQKLVVAVDSGNLPTF